MYPKLDEANLVLLRHAEFERQRDADGRLDEVLTRVGRRHATHSAELLESVGVPLVVYTSPQPRAVHSAEIIARGTGHAVHVDPDLAELRLRQDAGVEQAVTAALWSRARDEPLAPPCAGAESLMEVQRRALQTLRSAVAANPARTVVAITHGGVIDCVAAGLAGEALEAPERRHLFVEPMAVFAWTLNTHGRARVVVANATRHLEN